jgi:tRNA(fMet)-specific endonuclease VapC
MKAFDADVLTLIHEGNAGFVAKAALIPDADHCVPIIVAEQLVRGRLNVIRQAQAGKAKVGIERAYDLLQATIEAIRDQRILTYSPQAEALVQAWRQQKIKVGISDMRIAATCIVHTATLISRNRRDFDLVPGLTVEYW